MFCSACTVSAADVNETYYISSDSEDISIQSEDVGELEDTASVTDFDSEKNQTRMSSYSSYTRGCYNVTLTDSNTNSSLVNKTVYFSIDEKGYANRTDEKGVASLILDLNSGKYTVKAYFMGDDDYGSCNFTKDINLLSTVEAKNIIKYYKGSKQYSSSFFDIYGNALSNTYVTITVNGKTYTKKTDSKGTVSMPVNLKPGTYSIASTNPSTFHTLTTVFKILPTVTAKDVKNVVGDSKRFSAKFYKSDGKVLANTCIKIKINGKTHKIKTNSKGIAGLSLKNLKKGTYKVISYNKDGFTKTNMVKICPTATTKLTSQFYTFVPGESRVIKVKLTTSLGDDSNSRRTVKIKIGGKTYYKKTDSNGAASLNLKTFKKGHYAVEYVFTGNKFFKSSKSSNYVTLIDNVSDTALTVKGVKKFGYGANTPIKVAFTAGGVPLAKRTMTFMIEGKTYTRTTDNNGIASVPIDLSIGSHVIFYKTDSKYKVNGMSSSCTIDVFKRSNSKITWKCGTQFKDSLQTFKILLTGTGGKPVAGQKIVITIDGENHTGKTGSDGYTTIKSSVAIGKYKVVIHSLGDNDYLPGSASKTVNVKLSKFGGGLNEKNGISYLSAYLKSTRGCPVNNAKIKALVKSLTGGMTNSIDKAKALFNYVRDNIVYDYYYNTHKGALGALNSKSANCVDQAHLLVSMYRTAGFKARYVHGTCTFSDGVFGHVWTQVLIGNTWVVGDPISYKNSLGKIKNWNTQTYKLKSRYLSPPF